MSRTLMVYVHQPVYVEVPDPPKPELKFLPGDVALSPVFNIIRVRNQLGQWCDATQLVFRALDDEEVRYHVGNDTGYLTILGNIRQL